MTRRRRSSALDDKVRYRVYKKCSSRTLEPQGDNGRAFVIGRPWRARTWMMRSTSRRCGGYADGQNRQATSPQQTLGEGELARVRTRGRIGDRRWFGGIEWIMPPCLADSADRRRD